jgi:hypothetical protein
VRHRGGTCVITRSRLGAVGRLAPAAVVLAAVTAQLFESVSGPIRDLAGRVRVLIGGEGAGGDLAERLGAAALEADPVRGAAQLARFE